jgi:hypothetical protein
MMEAVSTSEMSVSFVHPDDGDSKRLRNVPEGSRLTGRTWNVTVMNIPREKRASNFWNSCFSSRTVAAWSYFVSGVKFLKVIRREKVFIRLGPTRSVQHKVFVIKVSRRIYK